MKQGTINSCILFQKIWDVGDKRRVDTRQLRGAEMGLKENKAAALRFLDALSALDVAELRKLTSADATWWLPASMTPRPTSTRDQFLEAVGEIAGQFAEGPKLKYHSLTAEDDRVCVEMESFATLKNGRKYNNKYHALITLKNGLVAGFKEYNDTKHAIDTFDMYKNA